MSDLLVAEEPRRHRLEPDDRFIYQVIETASGKRSVRVGCKHLDLKSIRNLLTKSEVARQCLDCGSTLRASGPITW